MAGKRVHERKREFELQFVYHERWLPVIAVQLKANVPSRRIDNAIAATEEALGDKQPDPSLAGDTTSISPAAGTVEGDWDFLVMPGGPSTGCKWRFMVLDNIRGLVKHVSLPAHNSSLDVLRLGECGLCDLLTLIELHA